MAKGDVQQSPLVYDFPDYQQNSLGISVYFDNGTHALIGAVITQEPGCVYNRILMAKDGTPPGEWTVAFTANGESTPVTSLQFVLAGFADATDVINATVTAAP